MKAQHTAWKYSAVEFEKKKGNEHKLKVKYFFYYLILYNFSRISLLLAFRVMKILLKALAGCSGSISFCIFFMDGPNCCSLISVVCAYPAHFLCYISAEQPFLPAQVKMFVRRSSWLTCFPEVICVILSHSIKNI